MKSLLRRILSFLPIIIFFAVCIGVICFELQSALRPVLNQYFALNSPTFSDGSSNAKPLIHALEIYKAKFQHYPSSLSELPATEDVLWLSFVYKYEPSPSAEMPPEYMLSFRKRWSAHQQYCYYSGDGAWLQSSDASCWDTPRTMWVLRMPLEY